MVTRSATEHHAITGREQMAGSIQATVCDLVLARVRLLARRRAAWLAHLWGRPMADATNALDASVQLGLDDRDTPDAEAAWLGHSAELQPLSDQLRRLEAALAGAAGTRLQQLAELFRLSEPEMDLLQTCVAQAVDPTMGVVYSYLQQPAARPCVTEHIAAQLFGYGRRPLWRPGCPLAVWGLVSAGDAAPGEPAPLTADPVVVDWLQGELRLDPSLVGLTWTVRPQTPLENWPVDAAAQLIERGENREVGVRVLVGGPPSRGQRTFAAGVEAACVERV